MTGFRLTAPESLWGDAQFDRGGRVRYTLRRWWTREPARWAAWLMLRSIRWPAGACGCLTTSNRSRGN